MLLGTLSESVDSDILRSKLNYLADEYLKITRPGRETCKNIRFYTIETKKYTN